MFAHIVDIAFDIFGYHRCVFWVKQCKITICFTTTTGSQKKVWWKCEYGHEWQSTIHNRCAGNGCPICANQRCLTGYNDFATTNPELLKEWDFEKNTLIDPYSIISGGKVKVWWKCSKCNNEWQVNITSRKAGRGCPVCGREKIVVSSSKRVKCIETGIIYKSSSEAGRICGFAGGSISACARGETSIAGGYHWEYIEEN